MSMIETTVQDYLISRELAGIGDNVFLEVPEDPPQEYILIEKTGSGKENRIDRAMIAVQSVSRSRLINAIKTNDRVKEAMDEFADRSDAIYSCSLNGDYNWTNTQTKEYRYQAVFNLYY